MQAHKKSNTNHYFAEVRMDLWEVTEYVGEALVLIGVVGEVLAAWTEPERKKLEKVSSLVLIVGLAVSLAALIATNEAFNGKIAELNKEAGDANDRAAQLEKDAAGLRKAAEDERLARVKIERSVQWRELPKEAAKALCRFLPPQTAADETIVITYWSDPEPALYATEFRDAIGACRPMPGRPDIKQAPALALSPWTPPLKFGVWLEFPDKDKGIARSLASSLKASGVDVTVATTQERYNPQSENRAIVIGPRRSPTTSNVKATLSR